MIIAKDISKNYGNLKALEKVTLSCKKGEIVGLLGRNGAGKTTLFKIFFGLVKPNSGTLTIDSNRPKPIGGIIEKPALYEYLNAKENLKVFSKIQGLQVNNNTIEAQLLKVGLSPERIDPVKNYSLGMKQRLGIAVALLNNPEYLILDEPFSGLDPIGIKSIRELILQLVEQQQIGIIISSHIIEELHKICDTLYIINKGKIINSGKTQEIISKNTHSYVIYASGIENSTTLEKYPCVLRKNNARVNISQEKVPELLQQLAQENIHITACVPEVNFDELFEPEL
ncbi:ABC transporter ATP-binding protein [Galbibacter sp. BG1]|uniref:ABC transporter ATP-binding protein n=1 Tax=Galbibacter sp. BG1 TaxID=1170699 RepID=UPI0015BC1F3C|nr:ABC transporter ATP-binding protein [Galbibacter sp. BG1]QLE02298.1 ABC transporter ATP-binding protein [Galbibacter sp. BG1]